MKTKTLAQRIADRQAAGALVVVVREADEALALVEATAAAETCAPVRIVSCTGRCTRSDENPSEVGTTVDVGGILAGHVTGRGTLILIEQLAASEGSAIAARMIREVALQARGDDDAPSRLILIERPETKIPQGIVGDSDVLDAPLPSVDALREELEAFLRVSGVEVKGNGEARHALASAVAGLPRHEAARLFARCHVEHGGLDAAWLRAEKAQRVTARSGGALTFEKTDGPDIGGADALRDWIAARGKAFGSARAKAFGLPQPKGIFLAGRPGTGKSEFARWTSRLLGLPLMRLDVGRLFGGIVGQTESTTRLVIECLEACAPCVVLLDEADKGFGGATGSSGDSGVTQRMFGSILTWLAEKTAPVFVVCTANRPWLLPAEFLRKGRFDEVFNVGAPDALARRDILCIHATRFGWPLPDADLAVLAEASVDFSGAELREVIVEAGFAAFADGERNVTRADVLTAIKATTPIAKLAPEDVAAMEAWASKNKVRSAAAVKLANPPAAGSAPALRRPRLGGGN